MRVSEDACRLSVDSRVVHRRAFIIPMNTDDFWAMVSRARRHHVGEQPALAALTAELARGREPLVAAFEQWMHAEIERLNTPQLRDIAGQLWVMSDESWCHLRAWCVSQGRTFVSSLMERPAAVLRREAERRAGPFDLPSGELFLFCVEYARVARAGAAA